MKKTLYSVFLLFITQGVFGQIEKTQETYLQCGQYEAVQKMQIKDPERYNSYVQNASIETTFTQKSNTIYTIPVVFHVLYTNGTSNISDAQIQDALNILNRDYRKLNSDVNNVHPSFLSITDDAYIQFEFAKIAPNGTCFEGITRTFTTSSTSDGEAQINNIISGNDVYQGIWPHNKYMNIYVCTNLGGAAGYTFLPNGNSFPSAEDMYYNGIFMLHNYTGSIGTSNVSRSRALTHEVGHWLNLQHTWGNDNNPGVACGNDAVSDTPITRGFTSCPNPSSAQICTPGVVENFENYMDYSFCSKMFTQGQVTRMRAAIVSNTGGRSNIWTTSNLQSVGVGVNSSLCSVDFEATQTGLCVGNSTNFSIINTTVPINTYSWTFAGGIPATSSAVSPSVTYNTPGTYQVSVDITTGSGNRTITKTAYINVVESPLQVALPYTEGFVNSTFPPANWSITNGGVSNTWVRTGSIGTAPTAGNSARINYYNTNAVGEIDDLNTPAFNLSGFSSALLTFDVAYRPYTGQSDKLEVLVSPGCGMDYEVIYSKAGTTLQTETSNTSAYTSPSTWRNESVNLTPYIGNNQVTIKFRGTNGYGNHIYLDNINVSGTSGGVTASFNASSSNTCIGQSVTFTNSSTGATSWNWSFGAGATPATATGAGPHSVTYATAGTKSVSLSVNGGSTSNQSIVVNALPTVSFGSVATLCVNDNPITLTQGNPSGGSYSGIGVSGNQYNPTVVGTHSVTYSYTNSNGCTNTANGQVIVDGCLSLTSEDINFDVFPNPTSGNVTISSSMAIDEVIVLDNVGRIVQVVSGEKATEMQLSLEHLATGSYHIQTKFGTTSKMTKLIVQ